jgi:uncharacterized protein YjiS (DUF1127 family)
MRRLLYIRAFKEAPPAVGGAKAISERKIMARHLLVMDRLSDGVASAGFSRDAARASPGRRLVDAVARLLRRRAVYDELMALDDRLLADIGLTRTDVAIVARTASAASAPARLADATVDRRPGLLAMVIRLVRARLERRRTINELMALDDRMLADIGLTRADLPALAVQQRTDAAYGPITAMLETAILRPLWRWNVSRQAAWTLSHLDDRQLADVGFVRGDIGWVAEELAARSLKPANVNRLQRVA